MVNIAGNQSAQTARILARAAASALMREEFDAVNIFEELMASGPASLLKVMRFDVFGFSSGIQPRQGRNLLAINGRRGESQFFFKRLLQNINVAVFAEHQGNNQPVISRANLSIRAVVSGKCSSPPRSYVGRCPAVFRRIFMERLGGVDYVARGDDFATRHKVT